MAAVHSSDFIGRDPIPKLLLRFATPAVISTFINCLYNIVDRLYIGRGVGANAQAGLSLTFPIMIILMAFGMMVGQGSSAVVSLLLGKKDVDDAEKVVGQAVAMFLLFVITFQTIFLVFLDKILVLFGGTPEAIPYAHEYLSIILWGNVFQHISFGMSNIIRSEGNATKCMYIIALGAILNIILDPIFIFCFKMGIAGAAYATVIAMMCSSTWVMLHFGLKQGVLKLRFKYIRIYPKLFWRVVSIGMAPCLMQFVHSAVVILYNHSCKHFAESSQAATYGIAAFGITNTVMMCLLMPTFGVMQGMQPIVGYNFGAGIYMRVKKAFRLALGLGTGLCLASALLLLCLAPVFTACFTKDEELIRIANYVMRAASLGFTFIAVGMITSNYFQSIGNARLSLFFSLTRQVIFLIPVLIIMPRLIGFNGIWWSGPVSDFLGGVLAFFMFLHEMKKLDRLEARHANNNPLKQQDTTKESKE